MTKNSEMEAKAAILDKCCQSVECLARGKVFDLVGTLDLPQSSSPETEALAKDCELYAKVIEGIVVVDDETCANKRREPRTTLLKAAAVLRGLTQAPTVSRHTLIETAIRSYCRRQSGAAVQDGRIYYAGLSIADLAHDIEAALSDTSTEREGK